MAGYRPEDLTPSAQQALDQAEAEARAFNHHYIGQEHLLIGLLGLAEEPIATIRQKYGISQEKVRELIGATIGKAHEPPEGEIGPTPRCKRAVQLAIEEATAQGRPLASGSDLLRGLLLEGTGIGATTLQGLGVTLEQVSEAGAPGSFIARAVKDAVTAWVERDRGLKRYLLTMPADLYQEVQTLAEQQNTNVAELLRRFTRLGILATRVQSTPGASLILREGDSEQRILLL